MVFTKQQIVEFINEVIIEPRKNAIKWAKITKQTPHLRAGYQGQHLASLITGVEGERSGARGNDLKDGSEVKACSRVDQLDKCKTCGSPVFRMENECPNCKSKDIIRSNDSKWLFSAHNVDDLKLLGELSRIVLVIDDYIDFDNNDFSKIRIQLFEIYPKTPRNKKFNAIMKNYLENIYSAHKKIDDKKNPAPKNFWPYTYQFYLCNPICVFEAVISDAYTENPKLNIIFWVEPQVERSKVPSVIMPSELLSENEFITLLKKASKEEIESNLKRPNIYADFQKAIKENKSKKEISLLFNGIDEQLREYLELRLDRIANAREKYKRRSIQ